MAKTPILGHIDCPTCGGAQLLRITSDKNGDPFGYCEHGCRQQLRIGGDKYRVSQFISRYPWAASRPVTVTGPAPAQNPVAVTDQAKPTPIPPAAPVTVSAQLEKQARSGIQQFAQMMGVAAKAGK